eukprot:PhM_4_TR3785/c0_g1_i1/m.50467
MFRRFVNGTKLTCSTIVIGGLAIGGAMEFLDNNFRPVCNAGALSADLSAYPLTPFNDSNNNKNNLSNIKRPEGIVESYAMIAPVDHHERVPTYDIVIIGGGFSGLFTAWWLRQTAPELAVLLLEKKQIASQASGLSAGILEPRLTLSESALGETISSPELARRIYAQLESAFSVMTNKFDKETLRNPMALAFEAAREAMATTTICEHTAVTRMVVRDNFEPPIRLHVTTPMDFRFVFDARYVVCATEHIPTAIHNILALNNLSVYSGAAAATGPSSSSSSSSLISRWVPQLPFASPFPTYELLRSYLLENQTADSADSLDLTVWQGRSTITHPDVPLVGRAYGETKQSHVFYSAYHGPVGGMVSSFAAGRAIAESLVAANGLYVYKTKGHENRMNKRNELVSKLEDWDAVNASVTRWPVPWGLKQTVVQLLIWKDMYSSWIL